MTINCKGKLLNLDSPIVMGILNVTPDSFYDGGKYNDLQAVLVQAKQLIADGATILDIGGYSSKPGANEVSEEEELNRVIPVISLINKEIPEAIISVDTFRSEVARQAIEAGASMVNDISAGELDNKMFTTIRELQVPYCLMHMQGNPQTMQKNPSYKNVVTEVYYDLAKKVEKLKALGINDLIIDPGFGFGKTVEHNYDLLNNLSHFKLMGLPILVGISRKSMIYKVLETDAANALNGTTSLNMIALEKGGNILRVHDVKEAKETITLHKKLHEHE